MDHSVSGDKSSSPVGGIDHILLLLSLIACGIGQYKLSFSKDFNLAVFFYVVGILTLAAGLVVARYPKISPWAGLAGWVGRQPRHCIILGADSAIALILSLYTLRSSTSLSLLFWGISVLLALLAAFTAGVNPRAISKRWVAGFIKTSPMLNEVAAVVAITAVGGALRLYDLANYPSGIHGDEGEFGTLAQAVLRGTGPHPFGTAFLGDPALFVYLETPFLVLFGQSITALRLFAALAGTLTLPAFYLFARALFGVRPAILAIAILAGNAAHINFSRLGLNIPQVMLFSPLALWLMWEGQRGNRFRCWFGAGVLAGITFYFHFSGRLLLAVIAVYLLYLLVFQYKRWRDWLTGGMLLASGFAIVLAPMILLLASESYKLIEHSAGRLIFNHWPMMLQFYKTGSTLDVLLGQFKSNILGFIAIPDAGPFYSFAGATIFPFVLAPFAVLGNCFALLRFRDSRYALISIWFWVVVIGGGVLTIDSPQAHRIVGAALPAIVSIAVILEALLQVKVRQPGRVVAVPLLAVIAASAPVAAAYVDVSHYFGPAASSYPWEAASVQGKYVASLGPSYRVFVAGSPYIYFNHGVTRYLAPDVEGGNLQKLDALPFSVPADRDLAVLVYPHANQFLSALQALYPSGQTEAVYGYRGQVIFTAFRIPKSDIARRQGLSARSGLFCYTLLPWYNGNHEIR